MSTEDVELARRFFSALAAAARTGDFECVYPFLAPDVHWLTPLRNLHGIGEVRNNLSWFSPREHLEVDFEQEMTDLGGGRIASEIHEIYSVEATGEFAFSGNRRIELTIRDGKIVRYEMQLGG